MLIIHTKVIVPGSFSASACHAHADFNGAEPDVVC